MQSPNISANTSTAPTNKSKLLRSLLGRSTSKSEKIKKKESKN